MIIKEQVHSDHLRIYLDGRLDALWAGFFLESLRAFIRRGDHHIVLDAGNLSFLSSAGIRSLVSIYKELQAVGGSLRIANSRSFVAQSLIMTGFGEWLSDMRTPMANQTKPAEKNVIISISQAITEYYLLNEAESVSEKALVDCPADWVPWHSLDENALIPVKNHPGGFMIGTGCPAENAKSALDRLGEFISVGRFLLWQPPSDPSQPDYFIGSHELLPEVYAAQAIRFNASLTRLLRFSPDGERNNFELSELLQAIMASSFLETRNNPWLGFVMLAETAGLIGASLIRSPALYDQRQPVSEDKLGDWLSWCGEASYAGQLCLIAGFVRKDSQTMALQGHIHAAVFPFQAIRQGAISLESTLESILNGPPPLSLMHLVNDHREIEGLGESLLVRGACWFGLAGENASAPLPESLFAKLGPNFKNEPTKPAL